MMFKSIDEAISWIVQRRSNNYSFEHFKQVCNKLNNPQNKLKVIHVAGTDGKGSTTNYLASLLMSQGLKVGTLTSPHNLVHQDRIRINMHSIPDDVFVDILNKNVDTYLKNNLSMFEMDYLIMCEYFLKEKVDIAVVEVGLGGKLDSTNVIDNPMLSIITTIGYDHMDRLGDTLEEICIQKCGIIKDNSKVLIGHLDKQCEDIVKDISKKHNCDFYALKEYEDLGDRRFRYMNEEYQISSYAKYQLHNASLAIHAFNIVMKQLNKDIDIDKAKKGLLDAKWSLRFEIVKENPRVIIDGAHNIHGISALVESFDSFKGSKCIIFSALKRKQYQEMIDILAKHCDELIITSFENDNAIDTESFSDYKTINDYSKAIDEAIKKYDNILICGSLYFMSEVVQNYKF